MKELNETELNNMTHILSNEIDLYSTLPVDRCVVNSLLEELLGRLGLEVLPDIEEF